jgi:hypothetical protein
MHTAAGTMVAMHGVGMTIVGMIAMSGDGVGATENETAAIGTAHNHTLVAIR